MSKIPTHLPPPSFHGWFFRYPSTDLQNQWRPVYYASGITKRHFRQIQAAHRTRIVSSRAMLEEQRQAATAAKSRAINLLDNNNNNNNTTTITKNQSGVSAAATTATTTTTRQLVDVAVDLAQVGLTSESSSLFLTLHHNSSSSRKNNNQLSLDDYARYITALSAPVVYQHLYGGDANFDKSVALKMMGDFGGNARAQEALSAFEMASSSSSSKLAPAQQVHLYNCLMQTFLHCGYDNVKRVHNDVYDSIGVANLSPNVTTYKHVMLALCLLANPDEANHIMTFLRSTSSLSSLASSSVIDTSMFNTLMLGYREARVFDRVDELWGELIDRRCPAPNVETAEEMIRSIVELGNTPLADPHLQFKAQSNVVERKRIPLVLHQMEQAGIMRSQLCPPVLHEVELALRQFSIPRHKFYEWGRAVKLFDFINFRRKHGWLYDMRDINIPLTKAPGVRPMGADITQGIAPFATETLPQHLIERPSWERPPLASLFNKITTEEMMEESRGGGDKYVTNSAPLHKRDPNWRNKVPQTRYDTLYGVSNPSMPTVGVRQHLAGTESSALGTDEAAAKRDAAIVRRSLSKARRVRLMTERNRTHRAAAGDN